MSRSIEWWDPRPADEPLSAEGVFGAADIERLERKFRNLVEALPAIVYIETDETPYPTTYISPRIEQVLGFPREAFGDNREFWNELLHPDDAEAADAAERRADETHELYVSEYRLRTADGSYRWFHDEAVFTEEEGGTPYWQGVMFDITERKETELRLQELEATYRNLVEQLPAVTYLDALDEQHTALYVSPQAEQLLGIPSDVFQTIDRWETFIYPDDRAEAVRRTREGTANEQLTLEYRMIREDGEVIWIRDTASVVRDAEGKPLYLQGLYLDVTEEKRREQELRETVALYRNLIDNLPGVVYVEGAAGSSTVPTYMSPRYVDLFGYTSEERLADPDMWRRLLHPDDRDRMIEAAERATELGRFAEDYRMIARDGREVWVHDETLPVLDDEGNVLFWQGVLFDITERKEVEQQLAENAAKFQTLAEHIPAVTYIERLGGPVHPLYVSPQYETFFGYTAEERMTDPDLWVKLLHPDDRDRMFAAAESITPEDGGWSLEYRMLHRDGHIVWVRDEGTLARGPDGEPLFWQGVLFDISENKRIEEELQLALEKRRQADEMKNTFLTAVSHDLRTPLSAILGSAITLQHGDELGISEQERRDLLTALTNKTQRLTALVTDLLDMDRLSRGVVEPRLAPVELGGLVGRLVADTELLSAHQVHLEVRPTVAVVDRSMVERIVENLMANTAKHTAPGTSVWIRVDPHPGGVLISVEDDGPGVPVDLRESLFQPFERGPTANPHSPGVGLGLSLVARFAELHGGRAWVEERDGGGASFRVFLPGG